MLQILPESLRRKLDAEAERILAQIIQMINYSADIRMDYGQDRLSLSAVDSDELARRLFEYQLQEESLLNGVCGMKVRHGKDNESLTHFVRKRADRSLIDDNEREVVRRVRNR